MDEDFRGINQVRIKTAELISKLKENRDTHQQTYKDALEGYFVKFNEKLEKVRKQVEKEKKPIASIKFEVPKDHTKEYDRLISMLEMSQDTELVISSTDYNRYVLDEWISEEEKNMLRGFALSSSNFANYQ